MAQTCPLLNQPSATPATLIVQGAEALLYKTTYLLPSIPCALKYRPSKPYRHPTLDARLTRHRILSEARVLARCRRERVPVPAVYAADWEAGWLILEWIEGKVVREVLRGHLGTATNSMVGKASTDGEVELRKLMGRIGAAVGRMHSIGIIHGDLTTSNMMLQPQDLSSPTSTDHGAEEIQQAKKGTNEISGKIVLIDFGLAAQSVQDEDRAVDLYVLERAFASTHPRAEGLFGDVLSAYGKSYNGAGIVLKKLEDVRLRGRKRSMLG